METAVYQWEGNRIYLEPDYKAIQWLNENLLGTPVVLQAPYGYYRENGVRIAVNTGFPTVLNPLHENEQRYDELIGPRHRDAERIYRTLDVQETLDLLSRYDVAYVYVGPFERAAYDEASLAKFDAMLDEHLELVYDRDLVRIYHVPETTRAEHGGYAGAPSSPVKIPTVSPRTPAAVDRDALRALERAAKANPENAGLQFELGDRYRQLGRPEDAIRVFERSLDYNPRDVAMYHTLGDTYAQLGNQEKALEQYVKATEVAPNNAAAYNKLGMAYREWEQFEEAAQAFETAVRIDPGFAEAYYHLGTVYERLGRMAEARGTFEQVLEVGADTDWEGRARERLQALGG
jgi:tetratricopeptide (TPR) repeat protein